MAERPLPEIDTDARAFWDGAAAGKLVIQRCSDCGKYQHYARPFCTHCGSRNVAMVEASGEGTIYSFTVIHRSPYDDLPAPYVVALVALAEGPRLLTNIVECDAAAVRCEQPVRVKFQALRDGVVLPVFTPAS